MENKMSNTPEFEITYRDSYINDGWYITKYINGGRDYVTSNLYPTKEAAQGAYTTGTVIWSETYPK